MSCFDSKQMKKHATARMPIPMPIPMAGRIKKRTTQCVAMCSEWNTGRKSVESLIDRISSPEDRHDG
jgi:hypothetical protein